MAITSFTSEQRKPACVCLFTNNILAQQTSNARRSGTLAKHGFSLIHLPLYKSSCDPFDFFRGLDREIRMGNQKHNQWGCDMVNNWTRQGMGPTSIAHWPLLNIFVSNPCCLCYVDLQQWTVCMCLTHLSSPQGKLMAYDRDGDGDFDMEDAKVLLGKFP